MLGQTNHIVNHVCNMVENRNALLQDLEKTKNEINQMKQEMLELKAKNELLDKFVTMDDLKEVIDDVKGGFDVIFNSTPRVVNDGLQQKIDEVIAKFNDLEAQHKELYDRFESIPVEFQIESNQPVAKKNIPKLNITKKKI